MRPSSIARTFFDEIRVASDPVAYIRGFVNSDPPTYEADWLDFKGPPSTDLYAKKWREMWVEALAGFANNQGGVIVWGIDARKDPETNVDAACDEVPVSNPEGLKSRLVELQRQATDPPVANVEIDAYVIPDAPGTGFVVCFVPEGPFKPYRSEDGRKSQYHVRSGDNFTVLSRSILQTMFFPKVQAVFTAHAEMSLVKVEYRANIGSHVAQLNFGLRLANRGTGTAKQTFVQVSYRIEGNLQPLHFSLLAPWTQVRTEAGQELETGCPMHPGRAMQLIYLEWEVNAESPNGASVFRPVPTCPAPSIELGVFCENQERQVIRIEFDMEEVIATGRCVREAGPTE